MVGVEPMTPALELLRGELTAACTTPNGRLVVSVPPQEGLKTSLVRELCVDLLRQDVDRRVTYVTYSRNVSLMVARAVRAKFSVPSDYSDGDWRITGKLGGLWSCGIGSATSARAVDVLLVDDPFRCLRKDQTPVQSAAMRNDLHDWWATSLRCRLAPDASVVAVQTRTHSDDLAGRLIAQGWPCLNIPALADGLAPDALARPVGTWLESLRGRTEREWKDLRLEIDERSFTTMWQGCPA